MKPKLLYASPFWPMKSGISEYSEALIYGLANYYDVTLLLDNYKLESKQITNDFFREIYKPGKRYIGFDVVIYNIGNNPHYHLYMADAMRDNPGYIILHDFVLYYLAVGMHQHRGDLFQSIYYLEGIRGINIVKDSMKKMNNPDLLEHKSIAAELPMNREIIDMSKGIFVHSNFAKNELYKMFPEKLCCKIGLVKMNFGGSEKDFREFIHNRYNIPINAYVTGSLGFISDTKQNELCCRTIRLYNQTHDEKIYYLMIGEGEYVNTYLDNYIIKTNFLDANEYFLAVLRCNLVFNLRYPTNGETSAALIQAMGLGKLSVVTDIGWFGELPNDIVIKVPFNINPEELVKTIEYLISNENIEMMQNAKNYVDIECAPEKIAADMFKFIGKGS